MNCGARCGWGAIIRSSILRSGTTSTRARCRSSRARATGKAPWPSEDPAAFQSACLQAIAAFEQGLGHDDYDGQIYWWMGLIWEILGERHSACGAFRRAMETDPDNFAELTRGKLRLLEAQPLVAALRRGDRATLPARPDHRRGPARGARGARCLRFVPVRVPGMSVCSYLRLTCMEDVFPAP